MKMIIAAIKPFKLEEVREALTGIGVSGLMVTEIKGFGAQADQVLETITKTARTGKIGDGKIFVLDVEQALRVRTGETGLEAL